ncbi:orotidine 5'-phosphate decarboxylase / HUMPS family protein [Stetteria hydrogenophila]
MPGEERFPVIVALDPPGFTGVAEWIKSRWETLAGHVAGCKLGAAALLPLGLEEVKSIVSHLKDQGCPLAVADLKIADVPHTSRRMALYAREAGFDVVISHAFPGADTVAEVASVEGLRVWLVATLSNKGARLTMDPSLPYFIKLASGLGVEGLVLPATEPGLVRLARRLGWRGVIASPGVGAQGAAPCSALESGATLEIVGRSLVLSGDPLGWLKANYGRCTQG